MKPQTCFINSFGVDDPTVQWTKSDPRIELKIRNSTSIGYKALKGLWNLKIKKGRKFEPTNSANWVFFGSFCRDAFWYSWGSFLECFQRFQIRSSFTSISFWSRLLTSWMFDWNMGRQTNSLLEMWVGICTVSTSILTKGPLANLSGTCCCSTAVGTLGGNPGSRGLIFF